MTALSWLLVAIFVAMVLAVVWMTMQIQLRAQARWGWRWFYLILALLSVGLAYPLRHELSGLINGLFITGMLLIVAFWPHGLSKRAVITQLSKIRVYAALSKVMLVTLPSGRTQLDGFVGAIRVARMSFKESPATIQQFLKEVAPKLAVEQQK
ncbi:hypothetical protein [Lacticaseibacillus saniviri]|uniref:LaaL n=1 Tax=Lacticaseibacillus saniviri JCM 17471 = DSM 24301 TaxID=1293598 RepID=A0A0R2MUL9_9LACO|nr:hypothetical protein [Lacticaseibacillus saniviri]KRO16556.1 hypothetical protein IV56_GL000998 [Lacticaseibacillus saniviri JCM 17471 = DSM 24301]MCG4281014.1 hypothetical protein [Lacticaseibacillus saniviri]